jgi:hypothetical protein
VISNEVVAALELLITATRRDGTRYVSPEDVDMVRCTQRFVTHMRRFYELTSGVGNNRLDPSQPTSYDGTGFLQLA